MITFPFVDVAVLDKEGRVLENGKLGKLVANSPCTMKRYKNDDEATKNFFIEDAEGKTWADLNVYGYSDKKNRIHMCGRIPKEGEILPPFLVTRKILKDNKNILSCEVINDDDKNVFVAFVETQPESDKTDEEILFNADNRCQEFIEKAGAEIYYRVIDNEKSFPLTGSGKRDVKKLKAEGLSEKCVRPIFKNGKYYLEKYNKDNNKIKKIK